MLRSWGRGSAVTAAYSAVDIALPRQMTESGNSTPRVDKLMHYMSFYSTVIDQHRPLRMLEIGSFYEDSLQMWQKRLHSDSVIVGIDLNSMLLRVADSSGVHVRVCRGHAGSVLRDVSSEFGPFDLVLDAGSLTTSHLRKSFRNLFPNAMADDGIFAAEDVYCDYWSIFNRMSIGDLGAAFIDWIFGHYSLVTDVSKFRLGQVLLVRRNP